MAKKDKKKNGKDQERDIGELNALMQNVSTIVSRMALQNRIGGHTFEGARDFYTVFGWPRFPMFESFFDLYERDGIAATLVDAIAEECWRRPPLIYDGSIKGDRDKTANFEEQTEFLRAFYVLNIKHNVIGKMLDIDKKLGYSRHANMLIGTAGDPKDPLFDVNDKGEIGKLASGAGDISYIETFDEGDVTINEQDREKEISNSRYGMPTTYQIHFDDHGTRTVHWTRVIHYREGKERKSRVYGVPRLKNVLNYMLDTQKVLGGSSEAFWLLIRKGLAIIAKEGTEMPQPGSAEYKDMQDEIEEYQHQLRRVLRLRGVDIQDMGSDVVSGDSQFNILISALAGSKRMPKRILLGSEMGQLASSQDDANWADVTAYRQTNICGPNILQPTIQRLLDIGALPLPDAQQFTYEFPPTFELNPLEKAGLAKDIASTIHSLSGGTPETIVDIETFIKLYLPDLVKPDTTPAQEELQKIGKLDRAPATAKKKNILDRLTGAE